MPYTQFSQLVFNMCFSCSTIISYGIALTTHREVCLFFFCYSSGKLLFAFASAFYSSLFLRSIVRLRCVCACAIAWKNGKLLNGNS